MYPNTHIHTFHPRKWTRWSVVGCDLDKGIVTDNGRRWRILLMLEGVFVKDLTKRATGVWNTGFNFQHH